MELDASCSVIIYAAAKSIHLRQYNYIHKSKHFLHTSENECESYFMLSSPQY